MKFAKKKKRKDERQPKVKFEVMPDWLKSFSFCNGNHENEGVETDRHLEDNNCPPPLHFNEAQPCRNPDWELVEDYQTDFTDPSPSPRHLNDRLVKYLSKDCRVKYGKLELKKPIYNPLALAVDIPEIPAIENLWLTSTEEFNRVLSVISENGDDQFRRSHITTAMKNDGVKAAFIAKVLDFLVQHGALAYKETQNTGKGRPPLPTYQVLWGQTDFFPQRSKK